MKGGAGGQSGSLAHGLQGSPLSSFLNPFPREAERLTIKQAKWLTNHEGDSVVCRGAGAKEDIHWVPRRAGGVRAKLQEGGVCVG